MEMTTPSKYAGLGAAIPAKVMIGCLFGVGVMLAVGVADGLTLSYLGDFGTSTAWGGGRESAPLDIFFVL